MTPEEFRTIREYLGLSQGTLRRYLGLKGTSAIARYESGAAAIPAPTALLMASLQSCKQCREQFITAGEKMIRKYTRKTCNESPKEIEYK